MSAHDVERAYAKWARAAEFVEYEGEAFYHGTIDGHAVRVDDGTRGDRCYAIKVWIAVEVTERRGVIKRREAEPTPMREALRRVLAEEKSLIGVRVDDGELSVSFRTGTAPEDMARVTGRLSEACRVIGPAGGVYR
jgi:hypothetical protein